MFINSTGNITQAREQAHANANWTGVPWVIYTDTSGNVRVCRHSKKPNSFVEIVQPKPKPYAGLMDKIGCSSRTVYRDIKVLRDAYEILGTNKLDG